MTAETFRPPAVGLQLLLVFLALVAGLGSGTLLNGVSAIATVLVAAPLLLVLFLLARMFADAEPSSARYLLLLTAWSFLFASLLAGFGELARPRRIDRNAFAALGFVLRLLAALALAVLIPTACVVAGFRRAAGVMAPPPGVLTPFWIHLLLGASAFGFSAMLFTLAMQIRIPAGRLTAIVLLALAAPIIVGPVWSLAYKGALSRWKTPAPAPLEDALRVLRERTGFSFARVLCLDPSYGSGLVCAVLSVPRGGTLLLSANLAETLPADQLLAVLAHEAVHLRRRHAPRKLAWGFTLTIATLASAAGFAWAVLPLLPRGIGPAANFVVIFPVLLARSLYEAVVTRRHEAEADEFAVETAGADSLLRALDAVQGTPPAAGGVHNRWTTHGTWAVRSARIRKFSETQVAERQ